MIGWSWFDGHGVEQQQMWILFKCIFLLVYVVFCKSTKKNNWQVLNSTAVRSTAQ